MEITYKDINITPVWKSDYEFLYKMLKNRNKKVNISHTKMPTYKEHCKFWKDEPYLDANIIYYNLSNDPMDFFEKVGYYYITHNKEIGIHIIDEYKRNGIGEYVIENIKRMDIYGDLFANINPNNKDSQEFFKELGFELIQYTYKFKR